MEYLNSFLKLYLEKIAFNMQQTVVYAGHMFVRRIQGYCQSTPSAKNLGLSPDGHRVIYHWLDRWGDRITTILDMDRDAENILSIAPRIDLLILDIGSNDINNHAGLAPELIHRLLSDFVDVMLAGGVRHVSIVPVTFKHGRAAISRDDGCDMSIEEAESEFQRRAHLFNTICARSVADQTRLVVSNRGLQARWRRWMSDYNWVHLSPEGMLIAARNLQSAVIHRSKVAIGQAGLPPR